MQFTLGSVARPEAAARRDRLSCLDQRLLPTVALSRPRTLGRQAADA
jgi:hypothetical protein